MYIVDCLNFMSISLKELTVQVLVFSWFDCLILKTISFAREDFLIFSDA